MKQGYPLHFPALVGVIVWLGDLYYRDLITGALLTSSLLIGSQLQLGGGFNQLQEPWRLELVRYCICRLCKSLPPHHITIAIFPFVSFFLPLFYIGILQKPLNWNHTCIYCIG